MVYQYHILGRFPVAHALNHAMKPKGNIEPPQVRLSDGSHQCHHRSRIQYLTFDRPVCADLLDVPYEATAFTLLLVICPKSHAKRLLGVFEQTKHEVNE